MKQQFFRLFKPSSTWIKVTLNLAFNDKEIIFFILPRRLSTIESQNCAFLSPFDLIIQLSFKRESSILVKKTNIRSIAVYTECIFNAPDCLYWSYNAGVLLTHRQNLFSEPNMLVHVSICFVCWNLPRVWQWSQLRSYTIQNSDSWWWNLQPSDSFWWNLQPFVHSVGSEKARLWMCSHIPLPGSPLPASHTNREMSIDIR